MALATKVSTIDPYDSRLSYEERAELRRKKRQERLLSKSPNKSTSSVGSTPNGHPSALVRRRESTPERALDISTETEPPATLFIDSVILVSSQKNIPSGKTSQSPAQVMASSHSLKPAPNNNIDLQHAQDLNGDPGPLTSPDSAFSELPIEEPDGGKMSKSHVSNSDSFTFENFNNFNGSKKTFAENLKFVDSAGDSASSVSKAQVVYRPIDVSHTADITMIPGSGYFDASQSQVDPDWGGAVSPTGRRPNHSNHSNGPTDEPASSTNHTDGNTNKTDGKEPRESRKSPGRSPFHFLRRNPKSKTIDEAPEQETIEREKKTETKKESPKHESGNPSPSHKGQHKRSISTSGLPGGKPPVPSSGDAKKNKGKKGFYSFREPEKSKPIDSDLIPGLSSSSREATMSPDSTNSDERADKRPSLRKRISRSFRDLVNFKDKDNSPSRSSWKFNDEPEASPVALLTYRQLETSTKVLQTEEAPPSLSLGPTEKTEDTSKVESMNSEKPLSLLSNSPDSDEYHTADDSELGSPGAAGSIQLLNSPTSPKDFGYAPKKTPAPAKEESSSKPLSKAAKSTSVLKGGNVISGKGTRKASTPVKTSSPGVTKRVTKTTQSKTAKSSSPLSSPRLRAREPVPLAASPLTSPRSSLRGNNSQLKKPSPSNSPRSSVKKPSISAKASPPLQRASIPKSPRSSQRTSDKVSTTKPLKRISPTVSPRSSQRGATGAAAGRSPKVTPVPVRKAPAPPKAGAKATNPTTDSPLLKRKTSTRPAGGSKRSVDASKETTGDTFTRFTRGRKPIKFKGSETAEERTKTIEHRKLDVPPPIATAPVGKESERRATVMSPPAKLQLTEPLVTAPALVSPTTPMTPGGTKQRKQGQTIAPPLKDLVTNDSATVLFNQSAANEFSWDVDSLLTAVGNKLDEIPPLPAPEAPRPETLSSPAPRGATVFEPTPLHSRDSSIDIDTFLEQAEELEKEIAKEVKDKENKEKPKANLPKSSAVLSTKKTNTLSNKAKSESQVGSFTAALPPRPPLGKQTTTSADRKVSAMGQTRPRLVVVSEKSKVSASGRKSTPAKLTTSTTNKNASTTAKSSTTVANKSSTTVANKSSTTVANKASTTVANKSSTASKSTSSSVNKSTTTIKTSSTKTANKVTSTLTIPKTSSASKTGSLSTRQSRSSTTIGMSRTNTLSRSSMRASTMSRKSSLAAAPLHGVSTKSKDSTLTRIGDRGSKTRSSTASRVSTTTSPRRGSIAPLTQDSVPARKTSTLASPARRSMKRNNSVETLPRKVKSGTLTRGTGTGAYASMRKSVKTRTSTAGLAQSANTLSMRRTSSGGRKAGASVSGGTLKRQSLSNSSVRKQSSAATGSPSRKGTLSKKHSADGFAAFDHISSQASSLLPSSDHRRNIRPKMRQKASTTHLKMLQQRPDVSTELTAPSETTPTANGLDPNTYSTYMAKKNLSPSAMAGLASKLDLSTVKLRKTGITDQVLESASGQGKLALSNPALSNEHDTKHPVMLLQIKGRRNIQTRLVEPSASSLNSGDVFVAVTDKKLVHWIGKSANIIEKARGSDVVMRILHKKELGCHATAASVLKEEERSANESSRKDAMFWEMLGGKKPVKSADSVPSDEVHEKAVNMVTMVYQLEGERDKLHFSPIHESSAQMVKVGLLDTKKILLFDFYGEVYVWIGKHSPGPPRKKAVELGRKIFDAGCKPPVFTLARNSPARASGRYRPRSSSRSRNSVVSASGRRSSKAAKETQKRPDWAMFSRMSEGAEGILFREKFTDWPEPGRIIKMKGHESSSDSAVPAMISVVLQPADVEAMVKPTPAFEGLRLEGANVHRGQGNFKVSRSTFACNRVRHLAITKWVVREFDNVETDQLDHGLFYAAESYVIRWGFTITVVRELEGLVPGQGMFAKDRQFQRDKEAKRSGNTPPRDPPARPAEKGTLSDASDQEENDEEFRRILETGGRDKCAYFFWQGGESSLNEKGASALMTVELDKERGPQVRVEQGKEPPAFLNLFSGGMILLQGRPQTHSLDSCQKHCRVFCVRGQSRSETQLLEVTPEANKTPLSSCLRSRGCYLFYFPALQQLYLWHGSKASLGLKRCAHYGGKNLRDRLSDIGEVVLTTVHEGEESNEFNSLIGDKSLYTSLANVTKAQDYTLRLFELSSASGEFTADEVLYPARDNESVAFPFLQVDLYSAIQPAIFLLDAYYEVYVWLGWWPQSENKLMREANATTGSAHSKWLRDKKLAFETAELYVKACKRTRTPRAYMVTAGQEDEKFVNLFPAWAVDTKVQELNCQGRKPTPRRVDVDLELMKYTRNRFKLEELKKKPLPEGVDPALLETYLSDEDFMTIFKMKKDVFASMLPWKQANLKKRVGLF